MCRMIEGREEFLLDLYQHFAIALGWEEFFVAKETHGIRVGEELGELVVKWWEISLKTSKKGQKSLDS